MDAEEASKFVHDLLRVKTGKGLSTLQAKILESSCTRQTYRDIAEFMGYEHQYIKDTGSELWKQLSDLLAEKIDKSNVYQVLKQKIPASAPNYLNLPKHTLTHDWGSAPDLNDFYGRERELATMKQWIVEQQCRSLVLYGMGGIGKTALTVKLVQDIQDSFDYFIWRSLRSAPPLPELFAELIGFLTYSQNIVLPDYLNSNINKLIYCLSSARCLLVLDDFEGILAPDKLAGTYRPGCEEYAEAIGCISNAMHQSCIIFVSAEKPQGISTREGKNSSLRTLQLLGLDALSCQEICNDKHLVTSVSEITKLTENYRGNPLALMMAARYIQDWYNESVTDFLAANTLFSDINEFIGSQISRLSDVEKQVINWLASYTEPVSCIKLIETLNLQLTRSTLMDAVNSLRARSLVEEEGKKLYLHPAIAKYVLKEMADEFCQEIIAGNSSSLKLLDSIPLRIMDMKDSTIKAQSRLLIEPMLDRLIELLGSLENVIQHFQALKQELQTSTSRSLGYARTNIEILSGSLVKEDMQPQTVRRAIAPELLE